MEYLFCCVGAEGSSLEVVEKISEKGLDIERKTFVKNVGLEAIRKFESDMGYVSHYKQGLTMSQDFAVRYSRVYYKGNPYYAIIHSSIEHVFGSEWP